MRMIAAGERSAALDQAEEGRMATLRTEFRSEGTTLAISRDPLLLTPILVQLEAIGTGGELLVIDEETGRIVIRHPFGCKPEEGDVAQPLP
jgi:hypothetical protein